MYRSSRLSPRRRCRCESRRSQLTTALRQRVRPIVIEDQELARPFARLLRARELQVWAPGEVVADTMSYSIARCYGTDIEGQWHMGRYVLPGNVEKVILKPKQDIGQTTMKVPRAAARPRNVSEFTPLSHVRRLSTTEGPNDAAAGLLVLCALVCGSVMFGFYMQTQQTDRLGLAAAYGASPAETKTYKSLARVANRSSEGRASANDDSREAGDLNPRTLRLILQGIVRGFRLRSGRIAQPRQSITRAGADPDSLLS